MMLLFCLLTALASGPVLAPTDQGKALQFPAIQVVDQDGVAHRFSDLVEGKTVALQFIFTTCPTVCPPMGAQFAELQKRLVAAGHEEISLISVSINPSTDTPELLRAWRERFGGGPGWRLVTGRKGDIEQLQKILQVFSADINSHTPFVILGNARKGFRYLNGLTGADQLAPTLIELATDQVADTPAARYFPNTVLTDQHGQDHRLYSDLMANKIVVINTFFTSCQGVCTLTMSTMDKLATDLGERLGRDVLILSITVDPETDTAAQMRRYAEEHHTPRGWYLLTADRARLDEALGKLGQNVAFREAHTNQFLIGNLQTGLWKKALGLAPFEQIREIVRSVVEDKGLEPAP